MGRRGGDNSDSSLVCWRNIDIRFWVSARSETQCCFVGAQLEGIILVTACVFSFETGAYCQAGWSIGDATTWGCGFSSHKN